MSFVKVEEILEEIEYPVLILSSKAGLGNYSVGIALRERLGKESDVYHYCIEDLIPGKLVSSDFTRYRWICEKAPWLLYLIYKAPVSYWLKHKKECFFQSLDLKSLKEKIVSLEARTVLATNHRAAFWVSALKRRGELRCSLWAFLTDYCMTPGWRYIFLPQVERFLGAVALEEIHHAARGRYTQIEMPVVKRYYELSSKRGEKDKVLITGGGWGLGGLFSLSQRLSKEFPQLSLYVSCGDNQRLYERLSRHFAGHPKVSVYKELDSLYPLIEMCGAVITKPGAVTIAETLAAQRAIFLIKGLPVCEEKNAEYAVRHLGARRFSYVAFKQWYEANG